MRVQYTAGLNLRRGLRGLTHILATGIFMVLLGCSGHRLDSQDFDFGAPRAGDACGDRAAVTSRDDRLGLRFLGTGGFHLEWRGEDIFLSPFVSNPKIRDFLFGRMDSNKAALEHAFGEMGEERVGAILVGHSHYDHLMDVPEIANTVASRATLWVNRSASIALKGEVEDARVQVLEHLEEQSTQLFDADGRRLPFRLTALPSGHAPHIGNHTFLMGESDEPKRRWERRRHWSLKAGTPFALVLELLDSAEPGSPPRLRIFFQDSGSPVLPDELLADQDYDLAIVSLASAHRIAKVYPQDLLDSLQPRHVLVTHYENFFKPWGRPGGFTAAVTDDRAERFLKRVEGARVRGGLRPASPACGPSTEQWTIPLVGEWLDFVVPETD